MKRRKGMLDFKILKKIEEMMAVIETVPTTCGMDHRTNDDIVVGSIVDDDLRRLHMVSNSLNALAKKIEFELRATQSDPGRNPGKTRQLVHLQNSSNFAFSLFETEVYLRYTLPNRPTRLRDDWSIVVDQEKERTAERRRAQTRDVCGN